MIPAARHLRSSNTLGRHRAAILTCAILTGATTAHADAPSLDDIRDKPLQRIAFGSCARQNRPQPIWDAVVDAQPDLFIFLGDNIYADTDDMNVMRRKYQQLAEKPGYQMLLQTCPIFATWDDHDYGRDDAGREYPMKVESQRLFLDFFNEPADSVRRARPGIYDAKIIGPPGKRTQIILLDTRYFRDPLRKKPADRPKIAPGSGVRYLPHEDTATTVLGDVQWRWLEQQLRQPAELRIIASSIQVVALDHDSEHWGNFPHERQRLFDLIRDTRAAGVIFISGDIHRGELSVTDGGVGYPLFDLTSSGLTQAAEAFRFDWPNRHRVGTLSWGNNFGVIEIDFSRPDPQLRLQIRDEVNETMINRKIERSLLQPGAIR